MGSSAAIPLLLQSSAPSASPIQHGAVLVRGILHGATPSAAEPEGSKSLDANDANGEREPDRAAPVRRAMSGEEQSALMRSIRENPRSRLVLLISVAASKAKREYGFP